MLKTKSFSFQLAILGGFIVFFFMFYTLTTSIYYDYKLESQLQNFESQINQLADLAHQKPEDVKYFDSPEYKDRYAKENLNLLNPGEKLIIIPQENLNVERGSPEEDTIPVPSDILNKTNPQQWWAYFFGQTLSVTAPEPAKKETVMPPATREQKIENGLSQPDAEQAPPATPEATPIPATDNNANSTGQG